MDDDFCGDNTFVIPKGSCRLAFTGFTLLLCPLRSFQDDNSRCPFHLRKPFQTFPEAENRKFVGMLLLLDIDGVMVPAKGWKVPELLPDGFPAFSAGATRVLQQLLSGDVTVLLTTSHKSRFSVDEWKAIFRNRGLLVENLFTLPENTNSLNRREEILRWAQTGDFKKPLVILDDDASLNDLPTFLKEKWVQTSPYIGLTEAHLEQREVILMKGFQTA